MRCKGVALSAIILLGMATATSQSIADPETIPYRIGSGDVLNIIVAGEPELTTDPTVGLVVGPDGRIALPYVGAIEATGKTSEQLAEELRVALVSKRILVDPVVAVQVRDYVANKINVLGLVKTPGAYPYRPNMTVRDAIAQAEGLFLSGDTKGLAVRARIVHPDGTAEPLNLDEALRGIGSSANHTLKPNDSLVIEADLSVSVVGQVHTPGYFRVQQDTRLSEVIALAGGFIEGQADINRVVVNRPDGQTEPVDLEAVLRGSREEDLTVRPGDVVFVPRTEREVTVLGYVEKAGKYPFRQGERVSDALAWAGGALTARGTTGAGAARGDLSRVILQRRSGETLALDLRTVLTGGAVPETANPQLMPGDLLIVPEERLDVGIFGYVVSPGRYSLRAGDRLTDALAAAGGPLRPTDIPATTTGADLANARLLRPDGITLPIDLAKLLTAPDAAENLALTNGDTLVIPESRNQVTVEGYVREPGYYEFRPGDTVRGAIALAGGVVANQGSTSRVMVTHGNGSKETINLANADPPLQPGDHVAVPFARNRVAVLGYAKSPGFFEWHEGDRIVDVIAMAGGAISTGAKQGDGGVALLIRQDPDSGENNHSVLDINQFFRHGDRSMNPLVQPDDVIIVPLSHHTDYGSWFSAIGGAWAIKALFGL